MLKPGRVLRSHLQGVLRGGRAFQPVRGLRMDQAGAPEAVLRAHDVLELHSSLLRHPPVLLPRAVRDQLHASPRYS